MEALALPERRGFEPPVLFVVSGRLRKARSFSGVTALKPSGELFSERSGCKFSPKRPDFGPFPWDKKAKEDRQFESPPLHQRVTANRWSDP